MSIIADRLRLMRIMNRWSQRQVAEQLKYSTSTINAWENDKNSPPAEVLVKYTEIYNCSADYILGLTDEVRRSE